MSTELSPIHCLDSRQLLAKVLLAKFRNPECIVNGTEKVLSLEEWQALDMDLGTTAQTAPDIQTIIQWGREMLQGPTQLESFFAF